MLPPIPRYLPKNSLAVIAISGCSVFHASSTYFCSGLSAAPSAVPPPVERALRLCICATAAAPASLTSATKSSCVALQKLVEVAHGEVQPRLFRERDLVQQRGLRGLDRRFRDLFLIH